MNLQTITYVVEEEVAILTLNRPSQLNAMNRTMLAEVCTALDAAERDAAVRAVVVTGAGGAFSTGFDLKEQMQAGLSGTADWRKALWEDFSATVKFWNLSLPTIAAVHGHCLAGAFELAMCCDLTVCTEDSVFGEPELNFGAGIVTMILPWLVGPKRAKEIILLGMDRIGAEEARRLGLVNRVVPSGEHLKSAMQMARRISRVDPALVKQTKRAINRTFEIMGLSEALQASLDIDLHIESEGSPDKKKFFEIAREKGMRAAFEWREARFAQ